MMQIYKLSIHHRSDGFCVEEIYSTDKAKLKREGASRIKGRSQLKFLIMPVTTL